MYLTGVILIHGAGWMRRDSVGEHIYAVARMSGKRMASGGKRKKAAKFIDLLLSGLWLGRL